MKLTRGAASGHQVHCARVLHVHRLGRDVSGRGYVVLRQQLPPVAAPVFPVLLVGWLRVGLYVLVIEQVAQLWCKLV